MATGFNIVRLANNVLRNRFALSHDLVETFSPAVIRKKDKLHEFLKGTTERVAKSELAKKIKIAKGYYNLEIAPPSMNEKEQIVTETKSILQFIRNRSFKDLTVKEAWLLFLVSIEVVLWFFFGETIGKMHFVGYKV